MICCLKKNTESKKNRTGHEYREIRKQTADRAEQSAPGGRLVADGLHHAAGLQRVVEEEVVVWCVPV
jgi:hypothetical protein